VSLFTGCWWHAATSWEGVNVLISAFGLYEEATIDYGVAGTGAINAKKIRLLLPSANEAPHLVRTRKYDDGEVQMTSNDVRDEV